MFLFFLLSLIQDEEGASFFRNLYETYRSKMYYAAWRVLKDPCMAEDVMQDTFFVIASDQRILKRLMELNAKSELYVSNYVTKMCRNEALRKVGTSAYQREAPSDIQETILPSEVYADTKDIINPEEILCRNADVDLIAKAMRHLSPEEERLIEMLYFQDFTMDEAASQLKITKNALYVRHHRALKTLAKILEKELGDC